MKIRIESGLIATIQGAVTMVLTMLFTFSGQTLVASGFAQESSFDQAEWIGQIREMIETLPREDEARYRNYYEAKTRLGIQSAAWGNPAMAKNILGELMAMKTPKQLPWSASLESLEMAIVQSFIRDNETDKALAFVQSRPVRPFCLSMLYQIATHGLSQVDAMPVDAVMQHVNSLHVAKQITDHSIDRFRHLLMVEQASRLAQAGHNDQSLEQFREALEAPRGVQITGWSAPNGESWRPHALGIEQVLIRMTEQGFGKEAFEHYQTYRQQLEKPERYPIPLELVRALACDQHIELARKLCEQIPNPHQRAFAYCELAEFHATQGSSMEAQIDLDECLSTLSDSDTEPSISLLWKLAGTFRLLQQTDLETHYAQLAWESVGENGAAKRMMIEELLQLDLEPEWRTTLLPDKRNTSHISLLSKIAAWYYKQGDQETARYICHELEQVGLDYSQGAAIGADGMRPMRSDIWAQIMTARAWAGSGEFRRSEEILSAVSDYHCCEGIRIVAGIHVDIEPGGLPKWIDSLERPELKTYAMLGVLEQASRNRDAARHWQLVD